LDDDRPEVHYCREQFNRLKALESDLPLSFRIVSGYPVGMILNVACEEAADLIVIASSRRNKPHLQLHGAVADGVLRQACCPVFCLKQPVATLVQPRLNLDLKSEKRPKTKRDPKKSALE
jgi:hypothetical protein